MPQGYADRGFGADKEKFMTNKINREDMLALTRRMNVSRSSFTRIAGCYVDKDGDFDGSFNVNFLKLSQGEKKKNIELAKAVPFAATNVNLKRYEFARESMRPGPIWQLLMALRECGLKNDALMDSFYDLVMEHYKSRRPYAVYVFHDRYDIPVKGADKERLGESEAVFEYLICVICPLAEEYEPGMPECGFLFPAYTDGGADLNHVAIFQADAAHPHKEMMEKILQVR